MSARGEAREVPRWARARYAGCAARGAGGQRGGSAGNVQPENKTKRQRLPCALGPSLGYSPDSGVAVFPTTRILIFFFPLFLTLAVLCGRFFQIRKACNFLCHFWWLTYTKNEWFTAKPHHLGGRHQVWIYSKHLK